MIIIRQYTNAKQLRIEASNRLAMARMFAGVNSEKMEGYKNLYPPLLPLLFIQRAKTKTQTTTIY